MKFRFNAGNDCKVAIKGQSIPIHSASVHDHAIQLAVESTQIFSPSHDVMVAALALKPEQTHQQAHGLRRCPVLTRLHLAQMHCVLWPLGQHPGRELGQILHRIDGLSAGLDTGVKLVFESLQRQVLRGLKHLKIDIYHSNLRKRTPGWNC